MNIKDFSLDEMLKTPPEASGSRVEVVQTAAAPQGIAIIGMAAQIGRCEDLPSFWRLLANGQTDTRGLPSAREADLQEYLRLKGYKGSLSRERCLRQSYLREIDKFDHAFFGLSRQEANFTDPNQRLFLQTAWAALEDAGYGGASVQGTATGVYLGFSSDFGEDYRRMVQTCAPDAPEISVAGNIKSIIASRIAYHLDLRGPSMLVDTACSSGLTALHLACQALHRRDCTMALAGAVKLDLVPIKEDDGSGIGTKDIEDTIAVDGRTKTFDENCDGTSGAEGVLAFVLKPLAQALQDGDHVHAVIRGSAINQDGLSVGITAPNSAAQEALILRALAVAGVSAESISYVEAHGTATRLGDPIEISGIERAFGQHTDRRQFCAVGSVKTNLGHMDNAAGLVGLAKVVLSLQHRELPASLNFSAPNRQIPFERSPVYVNDRHCPWKAPADDPRRAGINSFGLSGTNAHAIVEEFIASDSRPAPIGPFLLALSARTDEALRALAQRYARALAEPRSADWRPDDLTFTAATGRKHHEHRIGLCFSTLDDLRQSLRQFLAGAASGETWWHGSFRLVGESRAPKPGDLTESAQDGLTLQSETLRITSAPAKRSAQLPALARLYVAGATVAWPAWFAAKDCRRIPLPTYPFARVRCWVETTRRAEELTHTRIDEAPFHPLLSRLAADTEGLRLFTSQLSAETHWELADHKVRGTCILPGTCYVEMMLAARARACGGKFAPMRLQDIQFVHPLAVEETGTRDVHLQWREENEGASIRIVSRPSGESDVWETHAEGRWSKTPPAELATSGADLLRGLANRLTVPVAFVRTDDISRGLEIGDRWNRSFVAGWQNPGQTECLVHLRLPSEFAAESKHYHFHPALFDTAVNAMNHLLGNESLYLPFSYQSLDIFGPLPTEFFAHVRRQSGPVGELVSLDLEIFDPSGNRCATATGYRVKRVPENESWGSGGSLFHALEWTGEPESLAAVPALPVESRVLLIRLDSPRQGAIANQLADRGFLVTEIAVQTSSSSIAIRPSHVNYVDGVIRISADPADLARALGRLEPQEWSGIIYTAGLPDVTDAADSATVRPHEHDHCLDSLQHFAGFVQALLRQRIRLSGPLLVATRLGQTTANSSSPSLLPAYVPGQTALGALARIAGLENRQLGLRVVDTDEADEAPCLGRELARAQVGDLAVYRQGNRHSARLRSLEHAAAVKALELDERGVYLITGGTGALGLELANELARRGPRLRLALLGETPVANRSEWRELATRRDRRTAHRYQRLLSLAKIADVECHAVDVADVSAMSSLLDDLRQRCGPIRGIVHAAGRAGEGFLINKPAEQLRKVLRPKVAGAWLLHQLTRADDLQFFVLYSSIATVLHNPGQSDYTAANAFLDGLAHYRRSRDLPALSICWPAWREVGIAVDYGAVDEKEFFAPISTRAALSGLRLALSLQRELPPVLVLGDINTRLTREQVDELGVSVSPAILRRLKRSTSAPAVAGASPTRAIPVILRGLDSPDDFDRLVGQVWSETLAMPELEADVPFSDLGGNSILITQMFKAYESRHRGVMEMADLFSLTTIREQAAHLRRALEKRTPAPATAPALAPVLVADVDAVLERLARGELSIEEAERFV